MASISKGKVHWRFWIIALAAVVLGTVTAWWLLTPHIHPESYGIHIERFAVESKLVGESLDQVVVLPPGKATFRPVLILLHGRGSSPEGMLSDELFAALGEAGSKAPVVVLANGGEASYFHDRDAAKWGSYILKELLPAVDERWRVDPERVAIGGISMGGFGALDQGRLQPDRFCAVGGHSPAIFTSAGDTAEGAFDDAQDFARHDVYGAVRRDPRIYGRTPVWIDVGDEDPFRDAVQEIGEELETGANVQLHIWPGGHNESYWWSHVDEYIDFYATSLDEC